MKKEFYLIIVLFTCCLFFSSCSENLYNVKDLGPSEFSQSKVDTAYTLLAMTPLNGPNADTLRAIGLDIQETTNHTQPLPMGIDVVYINADVAPQGIGKSELFWATLESGSWLLIDGSEANIETFCKENLTHYIYGAKMIAFRSPKLDASESETGMQHALDVIDYGPKGNALHRGMLQESLWTKSAAVPKPIPYPYPKEEPTANATDQPQPLNVTPSSGAYSLTGKNTTLRVANNTDNDPYPSCISAKCVNPSDWNSNHWGTVYDPCNVTYLVTKDPGAYGCHYSNEKIDFSRSYAQTASYELWKPGQYRYNYRNPLRRQNCWDDDVDPGIQFPWISPLMERNDRQKKVVIFKSKVSKFAQVNCKSCYLDYWQAKGKSRAWGVDHVRGGSISVKGGLTLESVSIFSVSFEGSVERTTGTSQSVEISEVSQREFWVTPCMFKTASRYVGSQKKWLKHIYGQVVVETNEKYVEGVTELNIGIRYLNESNQERQIVTCVRKGAPQDLIDQFRGNIRTGKYYWAYSRWWDAFELPISTFKNCKL